MQLRPVSILIIRIFYLKKWTLLWLLTLGTNIICAVKRSIDLCFSILKQCIIILLPVQSSGGVQTSSSQVLQITFDPGHEIICLKPSGYIPFTLRPRSIVNVGLSNLGSSGSAPNSGSGQSPTTKSMILCPKKKWIFSNFLMGISESYIHVNHTSANWQEFLQKETYTLCKCCKVVWIIEKEFQSSEWMYNISCKQRNTACRLIWMKVWRQ